MKSIRSRPSRRHRAERHPACRKPKAMLIEAIVRLADLAPSAGKVERSARPMQSLNSRWYALTVGLEEQLWALAA